MNVEIKSLVNCTEGEAKGYYSILRSNSKDVDLEFLQDWYFNCVMKHKECNFHLIIYTDKENFEVDTSNRLISKGVHSHSGFVFKDVLITKDNNEYENYSIRDEHANDNIIIYYNDNGILKESN